jgi:hypothetical protein
MRYIPQNKRFDAERNQVVYGVWDRVRAIWVTESYSEWQCEVDAEYLNEISQPEEEKQYS